MQQIDRKIIVIEMYAVLTIFFPVVKSFVANAVVNKFLTPCPIPISKKPIQLTMDIIVIHIPYLVLSKHAKNRGTYSILNAILNPLFTNILIIAFWAFRFRSLSVLSICFIFLYKLYIRDFNNRAWYL